MFLNVVPLKQSVLQISAIRISAVDSMEADEEKSSRLGDSSSFTAGKILNEDVFISQLHRRAHLLNYAFQQEVLNVILKHSNRRKCKFLSAQRLSINYDGGEIFEMKETCSVPNEVGQFSVECCFANGEQAVVNMHSAPVKSLARMKEKISE